MGVDETRTQALLVVHDVYTRRVRIRGSGGENEPPHFSRWEPFLPHSNDQYAIFAPDVEAVTAEVLAWVPRSSKRQYILHLKNLPFLYYAHLPMSSNDLLINKYIH